MSLLKEILDRNGSTNGYFFSIDEGTKTFLEEQPDFIQKKFFRSLRSFELRTHCSEEFLFDELTKKEKFQFLVIAGYHSTQIPGNVYSFLDISFIVKTGTGYSKIRRQVVGHKESYYNSDGSVWIPTEEINTSKLLRTFANFIANTLKEKEGIEFNF